MTPLWPKNPAELKSESGALLFSSAHAFKNAHAIEELKFSRSPLRVRTVFSREGRPPILVVLGERVGGREISCSECSPEPYQALSGACSHVISSLLICFEHPQCPFPPGKEVLSDIPDQDDAQTPGGDPSIGSPSFLPRPGVDRLVLFRQGNDCGFFPADANGNPCDQTYWHSLGLRARLPGYSHRPEERFSLWVDRFMIPAGTVYLSSRPVPFFHFQSHDLLRRYLSESPFMTGVVSGNRWSRLSVSMETFSWQGSWTVDRIRNTLELSAFWLLAGKRREIGSTPFFLMGDLLFLFLPEDRLVAFLSPLSPEERGFLMDSSCLSPADMLWRASSLTSSALFSFRVENEPLLPGRFTGHGDWIPMIDIQDYQSEGIRLYPHLSVGQVTIPLFGVERNQAGDVLWEEDPAGEVPLRLFRRNRQEELLFRNIVEKTLGRGSTEKWISFPEAKRSEFYSRLVQRLEAQGFTRGGIDSPKNLLSPEKVRFEAVLTAGESFHDPENHNIPLEVQCLILSGDHVFEMPPPPEVEGDPFLSLPEGFSLVLDQERWQIQNDLHGLLETDHNGRSRIGSYLASMIVRTRPDLPLSFQGIDREQLAPFAPWPLSGEERLLLTQLIGVSLRGYQTEGVAWLRSLRRCGLGGVLADEMGLGKTLTVLSELALERHRKKTTGSTVAPDLIIVPATLLYNWKQEILRFAPSLSVSVHHGGGRKSRWSDALDSDIILTTYGTVRNDLDHLREYRFHSLVLDEAQVIKNPDSGIASSVFLLDASFRVALSGTPLENRLGDLWSIFSFVMPGLLGSRRRFERLFVAGQGFGDWTGRRISYLRALIGPLVLRRTKEGVLKDLPDKVLIDCWIEPSPEERRQYRKLLDLGRKELTLASGGRYRLGIFALLMTLRRYCCHPSLSEQEAHSPEAASSKFNTVTDKLLEALSEGHRVLLFTQFVGVLDLLGTFLDENGILFLRLDGSTSLSDRRTAVERFQREDDGAPKVFLASLKAGGVGLTLTNADYVFHYDPWWNPQVENQATDRAHRIGQNRTVFVYRFLTRGTVEEQVMKLKERKMDLFTQVMEGHDGERAPDLSELESLLLTDDAPL